MCNVNFTSNHINIQHCIPFPYPFQIITFNHSSLFQQFVTYVPYNPTLISHVSFIIVIIVFIIFLNILKIFTLVGRFTGGEEI
ncbi:hypothetical protein KSS87_017569 [Heliosperma pusillum]|nr:hypothetical protein KSS87_017569 [Heliosperma pusillum]